MKIMKIKTSYYPKAILSRKFRGRSVIKFIEKKDIIVYSNYGYAVGGFVDNTFYIRDTYIYPEHRRKGIASVLITKLMEESKADKFLLTPTISGEKFFKSLDFRKSKSGTMYR